MTRSSIRTYEGEISLCSMCGQPSFEDEEFGWQHFNEQWDGVFCPMFPLADTPIRIKWDEASLDDLKEKYPDTYPR